MKVKFPGRISLNRLCHTTPLLCLFFPKFDQIKLKSAKFILLLFFHPRSWLKSDVLPNVLSQLPDHIYLLVTSLGLSHLIPYYLPIMTTLMLVIRTHQINQRNKRSITFFR
jgi:hypothetical protein